MKLLFDENLSPRLVTALSDLFPESAHVDRLGLGSKADTVIWEYAKTHGYVLASRASCKTRPAGLIFSRLGAKAGDAGGHFWHDTVIETNIITPAKWILPNPDRSCNGGP